MESGRVSSIDLHIKGHFNTTESRKLYGSFAECVLEAFSRFPTLSSVAVSGEHRSSSLVTMLRQGAKERCRVTERTDGTIVLRPSQARQRAKKEERELEGDGHGETDAIIKKEEE